MRVVNQGTFVHRILTGHPMLGPLTKQHNERLVMYYHIILFPMPAISPSATLVLVRIQEQYLIKEI